MPKSDGDRAYESVEGAEAPTLPPSLQADRAPVPLLRSLEGLRLIASIGIASVHILPHAGFDAPRDFTLFVDLFFVISGIVIGSLYAGRIQSWADYGTFMRRRLARIYPLHFATLIFYVFVGVAVARYHLRVVDPDRFDPGQIVPNLMLVHAWFPWGKLSYNFVSWSISAEFFLYLSFPLIAALLIRSWRLAVMTLLAFAIGSIAIGRLYFGTQPYDLVFFAAPVRAIPSFALGVFLSRRGGSLACRFAPRVLLTASNVLFAAVLVAMILNVSGYALIALIYLLVAASYFCDLRCVGTFTSWNPISRHGELTYSIYMLHVPAMTVLMSFLFPWLLGRSATAIGVSVALSVAILAIVAQLSFSFFENPVRKALR